MRLILIAALALSLAALSAAQSFKYEAGTLLEKTSVTVNGLCHEGIGSLQKCSTNPLQRSYSVRIDGLVYALAIRESDSDWNVDPLQDGRMASPITLRIDPDGKSAWVPYRNPTGQMVEAKYALQSVEPYEGSRFDSSRGAEIKRYHPAPGVVYQ